MTDISFKNKNQTWMEFAITNYCQAKCPACNRTDPDTLELNPWIKLMHFDVDLFKKTITKEYAQRRNLTTFKFCGEAGDPMMHPRVSEFIDHAFDVGALRVTVNTNGGLRNTEWYTLMGEKYGESLQIVFGIDGVDHETNNKYRIGVDTDKAFKNMIAFHEAGGDAKWQFILFDFNYHQLPEAADIRKKYNMNSTIVWNRGHYGLIKPDLRKFIEEKYRDDIERFKK